MMRASSSGGRTRLSFFLFGIFPSALGLGLGQYLNFTDAVWLTNSSAFWPLVCVALSASMLIKRCFSPFKESMVAISAWLIATWTWCYFPFWLTAHHVPASSAVVSHDGRVSFARDLARGPNDQVWLMSGKQGRRIAHNVEGKLSIESTELQYRYQDSYISTAIDGADLSAPLISAATGLLKDEARKPRLARIALFDQPALRERLLSKICRMAATGSAKCPIDLVLRPDEDAVLAGALWSSTFTEREAIDERHLPALANHLTSIDTNVAEKDQLLAVFLSTARTVGELALVARQPHLLDDGQFDTLIERILAAPGRADELVKVVTTLKRLSAGQRHALRQKILRDAGIAVILNHAVALHITDVEVTALSHRLASTPEIKPELALQILVQLGNRLPNGTQQQLGNIVSSSTPHHALTALREINFSSDLRKALTGKILTDATAQDFKDMHLSKSSFIEMLAPNERRHLIAHFVAQSVDSEEWLDLAVELLPFRELLPGERKSLIEGLLFKNARLAMEFVSLNHRLLPASLVNEITRDYTKTIRPDVCLHLSHRNKNRRIDYFSDQQVRIFLECADRR